MTEAKRKLSRKARVVDREETVVEFPEKAASLHRSLSQKQNEKYEMKNTKCKIQNTKLKIQIQIHQQIQIYNTCHRSRWMRPSTSCCQRQNQLLVRNVSQSLYLDQNEWGPGATPETHPDVCEFAAPQLQPPALTPAMAEKLWLCQAWQWMRST